MELTSGSFGDVHDDHSAVWAVSIDWPLTQPVAPKILRSSGSPEIFPSMTDKQWHVASDVRCG